MAAAILLTTASGLITKILDNARSAAASYLSNLALSGIGLGDKEGAELRSDMKKALLELASIHDDVKQLGTQLSKEQGGVKRYHVQTHMTFINSLYQRYMDVLTAASNGEKVAANSEDFAKTFDKSKVEFQQIAQMTSVRIAEELDYIHLPIAGQHDQNLLTLASANHIMDRQDFMSYYHTMKGLLLEFWECEANALTLIVIAKEHPGIAFIEADAVIERVKKYLNNQETFFKQVVPLTVIGLAEGMLSSPTNRISLDFRAHGNK
jgi:hypothetical protein